MEEAKKKELISEAAQAAGSIMLFAFHTTGLGDRIEATLEDKGQRFKLTFEKEKPPFTTFKKFHNGQ